MHQLCWETNHHHQSLDR